MIRDYSPQIDFDEVFSFMREILSEPPYDDAREELLTYPDRKMTAKVAVDNGDKSVGFCAATHPYWNNIAIIDYLVVAPTARNKGIGRQLIAAVEATLQDNDIRFVCVQTATWNLDGIRFYERLGYSRLTVLPDYFGDGNDAVWLSRSLLSL
ncbi:GNAT family N-acetyltransferase [bacterium]|nr:GNAT family N-acetyltransferase [bacterium]